MQFGQARLGLFLDLVEVPVVLREVALDQQIIVDPLRRLVDGTLDGLRPITHPGIGLSVIALSLLAWAIEATMYIYKCNGPRGGFPQ